MQPIKPFALCGIAILLFAGNLAAQGFSIERSVIAPGGGFSSADDWTLDSTLGQPAAGRAEGGPFTLHAGYWVPESSVLPPSDAIFADGFEDTP